MIDIIINFFIVAFLMSIITVTSSLMIYKLVKAYIIEREVRRMKKRQKQYLGEVINEI